MGNLGLREPFRSNDFHASDILAFDWDSGSGGDLSTTENDVNDWDYGMRSNFSILQGAARGRREESQEDLEFVRDGETSPTPFIKYVFPIPNESAEMINRMTIQMTIRYDFKSSWVLTLILA